MVRPQIDYSIKMSEKKKLNIQYYSFLPKNESKG
jgi:hypothetical protein